MEEKTRPGVVIYFEDLDAIDEIMDKETFSDFIHAVVNYARYGEWVDDSASPIVKAMLKTWKQKIDRDGEKYQKSVRHSYYMNYVKSEKESGAKEWMSEKEWTVQYLAGAYQSLSGVCQDLASSLQNQKGKEKEEEKENGKGKGKVEGCKGDEKEKPDTQSMSREEFAAFLDKKRKERAECTNQQNIFEDDELPFG